MRPTGSPTMPLQTDVGVQETSDQSLKKKRMAIAYPPQESLEHITTGERICRERERQISQDAKIQNMHVQHINSLASFIGYIRPVNASSLTYFLNIKPPIENTS